MFNFLRTAVSNATAAIRNALGGNKPKPAPPPPPAPTRIAPIPTPSFAPLANWGESAASVAQRTSAWRASPGAQAQGNWQADQAAAALAARVAAERRAKELARQQKQAALDRSVGSFGGFLKSAAQKAAGAIGSWFKPKTGGTTQQNKKSSHEGFATQKEADDFYKWYNQQTPEKRAEVDEYNRTKNEYAESSKKAVDQYQQGQSGGWFNKLTLGNAAGQSARNFAQSRVDQLSSTQVKKYQSTLDNFLKTQAAKKAAIEGRKFDSQAEFDAAVKEYTKWESDQIKSLEYTRASTNGMLEGYGAKSSQKLNDPISKVGGWFNKNIANGLPGQVAGGIFKYTLGEGGENLPSLATIPSRAVNALNNWLKPNDNKNYHGGITKSGIGAQNPWQASHNQRNLNFGQPKPVNKDKFIDDLYNKLHIKETGRTKDQWYKQKKNDIESAWTKAATTARESNFTAEFLADPLPGFVKAGKVAKGVVEASGNGWFGKASSALSQIKSNVANNKSVKWLTAESKTPEQNLQDAIDAARTAQGDVQRTLIPRINEINKKLARDQKLDISIFDDFARLTDSEAAMLQRMVGGKASARDRVIHWTPTNKGRHPTVTKLEELARRWTDFSEKMKSADNVKNTSYGRDKKFYAPNTTWFTDRKGFLKRRGTNKLTATEMHQGAVDRYFKSNLDDVHATTQTTKTSRLRAERDELVQRYDKSIQPARVAVEEARRKSRKFIEVDREKGFKGFFKKREIKVTPTKRAAFNSVTDLAHLPSKVWKKSVLGLRPAWYVNNEIYNIQATGLAGGVSGLGEKVKMINPRYARKAMDEVPDSVRTNLVNDVGKGVTSKIASGQENWSRVAAFRALKKKGLSDEAALKRVDKYFFNYGTKNWERPLKSVMPFWSWNKGLTKAATTMPVDRPYAAKVYNELDRHQRQQFDQEFETIKPELLEMGYTEQEVETIKTEQAKYYKGKFKIGDKWFNTPFNAFSEKGLAGLGFNPYLSAAGESGDAVDNFGRQLKGKDASLSSRVMSKFPQIELGKKGLAAWNVKAGKSKPRSQWIGAAGSEGYGLTKERQGFDSSKPNYDRNLDPRAKVGQDALAFLGVPRFMEFDKGKLVETKRMQKVVAEYFAIDAKNMDFAESNAKRQAVFKKYGISADDFYGGILSKYDSEATKTIKNQKNEAAAANKALFDEYAKQPKGTRNQWATEKLRGLVAQGYFDKNPFLKSFKWLNPDSVAKADRQAAYQDAKRSGNWSKWTSKYGDTRKTSAKKIAYEKATRSGDWGAYRKTYGTKTTPYQFDGKFFKSQESMEKYKNGSFWKRYIAADKPTRRTLLAENPEFNKRSGWTDAQWDEDNLKRKAKERQKLRGFGNFASLESANLAANKSSASTFVALRVARKKTKSVWRLPA